MMQYNDTNVIFYLYYYIVRTKIFRECRYESSIQYNTFMYYKVHLFIVNVFFYYRFTVVFFASVVDYGVG